MILWPSPWAVTPPPSPDDGGTSTDYIRGAADHGNDDDEGAGKNYEEDAPLT